MKPIVTVHSWFAIGYRYKFVVCEKLIKTSFVVMFCFTLVDFNMLYMFCTSETPRSSGFRRHWFRQKETQKTTASCKNQKIVFGSNILPLFFKRKKRGKNLSYQIM